MSNFEPSSQKSYVSQKQATNTRRQKSQEGEFLVQFWGVRGLIPTPTSNTRRYGGNTACVEVQVAGKSLIFDGGTGLRILGKNLLEHQQPLKAHLFFTNSQSNRIQGFPFFDPAFLPENCFHIYGTAASNGASIKQCLYDQMLQPHFPYPLQVMQSELQFHNLTPNRTVKLDDVNVTTALINWTQRSIGYRVAWEEYSVAYITDIHECIKKAEREHITRLTQGVDLLIANATYTLPAGRNYLESDIYWLTAVELAKTVGAKQLVLTHHHPDDHDDFLDQVQTEVKFVYPKALLALEGLILSVK
ncbi:MBL fold metallo-hydrolase [Aetokthonos hydrillicola Thurmond2011]|jgi:phosphoribosyl 1,2-cyclic phosphodiesterase|uniref:MBL fold metallo-hydrolase n=1 Tax=Aetokthonos hydrillicola Thurmond2011 TaxID=2712845 RepID=A0AAP5M7C3_9CYAN|nr:MBL fold metallo-hydrolase [Aetokthonos hydrillicola]MBW4587637.1 MBL fold metallo-hydrolase [Aetokthonos hydrillicola CCALA 1050]MDR9897981.1 MBL fold metallo-hydrolase [Aetokthonos hydrillicola Thurmond2011]